MNIKRMTVKENLVSSKTTLAEKLEYGAECGGQRSENHRGNVKK